MSIIWASTRVCILYPKFHDLFTFGNVLPITLQPSTRGRNSYMDEVSLFPFQVNYYSIILHLSVFMIFGPPFLQPKSLSHHFRYSVAEPVAWGLWAAPTVYLMLVTRSESLAFLAPL